MNLRELLRNDFSDHIRNRIVKDSCEFCGSNDELHLHHIDKFHNLLMETLEGLKLQELDSEEYDSFELDCIRNFMLAKQIKCEYKTLCKSCHIKLHNKEKYTDEYKEHYYNPYGSFIFVNVDKINKTEIPNNYFLRFLSLCCRCNYNGILTNGRKNIPIRETGSCELQCIYNLNKTETIKTTKYLLKNNFIFIKDDILSINKEVITKGGNNYKNRYKIFINGFKEMYNKINPREQKTIGEIIKLYISEKESLDIKKIKTINCGRYKKRLKKILGNSIYFKKNLCFLSPSILYKGELNKMFNIYINKWDKNFITN